MNSVQFLSHEEVCTLTGAKTKAGQITTLKRNGIRHTIKRSGWPCVIAAAVIGEVIISASEEKPRWQPRMVV